MLVHAAPPFLPLSAFGNCIPYGALSSGGHSYAAITVLESAPRTFQLHEAHDLRIVGLKT